MMNSFLKHTHKNNRKNSKRPSTGCVLVVGSIKKFKTSPNRLRAGRRLRLSSRRGDNENRALLQNDGLIGQLRGARDRGLRGELIAVVVLLFERVPCYASMMIVFSNSIIFAASATTAATTTSCAPAAQTLASLANRQLNCYRAFTWKCYRAIAELLQSISGTSLGSPRSAMAAMLPDLLAWSAPIVLVDDEASPRTRKAMQAATLRISMMNKLHDLMSEEDFEALRMTSMERVTAATLAEKVHDLGCPFDVVATSISSSNINEGVQEYIQLMGNPQIIDDFLYLTVRIAEKDPEKHLYTINHKPF